MRARYLHTNVVARDWRRLAAFYTDVFGCRQVGPVRALSGPEVEAGTGVPGAALAGVQLALPGHGVHGPTLEIFEYPAIAPVSPPAPNRPGLAHLAFEVADMDAAVAEVIAAGGERIGTVVTIAGPEGGLVTWCYLRDPEGNVVELIRRSPADDSDLADGVALTDPVCSPAAPTRAPA